MPVVTRKVVFQAVRTRSPEQRKALSQKLGKNWSHATTDQIAQAIGMQGTPRKSAAKGTNRAKSTTAKHGFARSFASENAAKNLSDNETKRALIKGRLVRSIKSAVKAKEKSLGRKLDPKEKKAVAARAFGAEVKAIRAGVPENKPLKGNKAKAQEIEKRIALAKSDIEATKIRIKTLRDNAGGHSHSVGREKNRLKQQKEQLLELERSHPDRAKQIRASEAASTPQKTKKLSAIEGGNKTGVESLETRMRKADKAMHRHGVISKEESNKHRHLSAVDGGKQSLQDLFKQADKIGSKYQDGTADLDAQRQARQIREQTGVASLVDRATGGTGLRAVRGGKGKKPATVTDIESKRKKPKSSFAHTPPPGVSVAEHRANLRRQYGAESGTRVENLSKKESRRADIGLGDTGGRSRVREVADRVSEVKPTEIDGLSRAKQRSVKLQVRSASSGDGFIVSGRNHRNQQIRIKVKTREQADAVVNLHKTKPNHTTDELNQAMGYKKPKSTVSRGTKTEPWAGDIAPTGSNRTKPEMVRGRSID